MTMSLRNLFLTEDDGDLLDGELDETLKAQWSRLCHDLTGRGFLLEASTIDALLDPWFSLVSDHYDPWLSARITSNDRRRLGRMRRALQEAIKVVGPDPRATAHQIGGWVEGHFGDLQSWIETSMLIEMEITHRLNEPRRLPGRPRDKALRRLAMNVACALADADEPVKASRGGLFAKVLSRLITEAELPVPRDLFRAISATVKALPTERRWRKEAAKRFAEFKERRTPARKSGA